MGHLRYAGAALRLPVPPSCSASRRSSKVLRSRYGMDVGTPLCSDVADFDMDLACTRR